MNSTPDEATAGRRDLVLDDIPIERVQDALKALLDIDSLRDVCEVHLEHRVVRAVLFSRDDNGKRFADGDRAATHTVTRKVARS